MRKYMARRYLKFITAAALIFFISMVVPAYADNAQDLKNSESAVTEKNSDIQVVMYMTDWCPYCKKAGKYIKSLGVNLIEYDIEKNESRKKEMKVLSGGSGMVPLIYVEGIIRGYVPEEISEAVEKRKKQ
jgi:glutaredoxin